MSAIGTNLSNDHSSEIKRDRWGRPSLLSEGDTAKRMSFLRPSSIGSVIKDNYTISAWQQRMVAKGVAMSDDIVSAVRQLDVKTDRDQLNQIVNQARDLAGGSEASDFGTAVHAYIEGKHDAAWGPEVARCGEAAKAALAAAGLTIIPETQELFVVNDDLGCAGSTDGLLRDASGVFVFDFKTGSLNAGDDKDGNKAPCAPSYKVADWVVQLAIYANANACYDFQLDARVELPEAYKGISKEIAKVVFIDRDTCAVRIIDVDLVAGLRAARLALAVVEWQKTKVSELATVTYAVDGTATVKPSITPALEQSMEAAWAGVVHVQNLHKRIERMSAEKVARFETQWSGPPVRDCALGKTGMTIAQFVEAKRLVADLEANAIEPAAATDSIKTSNVYVGRLSGVTFVDGYPANLYAIGELLAQGPVVGHLERVLDNPHDANAVAVVINGKRAGWIPADDAQQAAPLLDAGQHFDAHVQQILVSPDNPNRPGIAIRTQRSVVIESFTTERRTALVGRRDQLITIEGGIDALAAAWPTNVLTFRQCDTHTEPELDLIEAAFWKAEARVSAPFPNVETPSQTSVPAVVARPQRQTEMLMDPALIDALKAGLTPHLQNPAVIRWANEAHASGNPIGLQSPTARRYWICSFIVELLTFGADAEEAGRAIVAAVQQIDQPLFPTAPFGASLGTLTATEAEACCAMASDRDLRFAPDDNGVLRAA